MWYRADYEYYNPNSKKREPTDSDFFECESDEHAIAVAIEAAKAGTYFADLGYVDTYLVQVTQVDDTQECFPDIKTIYY